MCFNYISWCLLKKKKEKSDNENENGGGDQLDGEPYTIATVHVFDTDYKNRLAMKNTMGSGYNNNSSNSGGAGGGDDDAFSIGAMRAASFSSGDQKKAAPARQYDRHTMQ